MGGGPGPLTLWAASCLNSSRLPNQSPACPTLSGPDGLIGFFRFSWSSECCAAVVARSKGPRGCPPRHPPFWLRSGCYWVSSTSSPTPSLLFHNMVTVSWSHWTGLSGVPVPLPSPKDQKPLWRQGLRICSLSAGHGHPPARQPFRFSARLHPLCPLLNVSRIGLLSCILFPKKLGE